MSEMPTSPAAALADKPTVVQALSAVMEEVQVVRKNKRNDDQGYMFRGVDAVVNAVGPVLRKHGVVPVPILENTSYRDVTTSRGKPSREVTVQVRYRFYGPAGDYIDAVVPGESMDFGDKGSAKAMSVAYRIVLLQALCIPTDDVEPDSQSYERAVEPPRPPEPEWDPIEQETVFIGWQAEIADAKDLPALNVLSAKIHAERREGKLSPVVYSKLAKAGAARRAELSPS